MPITIPSPGDYQDIRDGVRACCAPYDDAYWRAVDEARGYPEEWTNAVTQAGWLAAMIPA